PGWWPGTGKYASWCGRTPLKGITERSLYKGRQGPIQPRDYCKLCIARARQLTRRGRYPSLAIGFHEVADPADGHVQIVHAWQGDDTEMVRPGPVEGGALHDEDLLREQQIQGELLVVVDRTHLRIEDRKSTRLSSSHVKISYAVF